MNPYKLRAILEMIRSQGRLPADEWGQVLNPDDLLVWFGLADRLDSGERLVLRDELALMAEAEMFMDRLHCKVL